MNASTSTQLLGSYVPALVKRRLRLNPAPIAEPQVERLSAAALMADISGFTRLTERFAARGDVGAEELTRVLNEYLGRLIETIEAEGGDVIKFAGDALYAVWPAEGEDLAVCVRRAAQCGLEAQARLNDYPATEDVRLSMKIGIGAGELAAMHVGGVFRRWEYLLTGPAVLRMGAAETRASTGEIVLDPQAWRHLGDAAGEAIDDGFWRLHGLAPLEARPLEPDALAPSSDLAAAMLAYIPAAIRDRLVAGQTEWLAELRRVTVLFVNVRGLDYGAPDILQQTQAFMRTMQGVLYHYEGSVNKLLVDDKGTSLIVALGLPPLTHEDDATRGAKAALDMHARVGELGLECAVGVATGRVFCGPVGAESRREYTMIGDAVNLAARLMQAAQGGVLCDPHTREAAAGLRFEPLPSIRVKGKAESIAVFRPASALLQSRQEATRRSASTGVLVGRTTERARMEESLAALQEGRGGTIVVEGDAGIGKSRLLEDLVERAKEQGVPVLVGQGDAIEKNALYFPWKTVFGRALGLEEKDEEDQRRALHAHLSAMDEAPDLAPLLNPLLSFVLPESETSAALQGKERADRVLDLLVRLLAGHIGSTSTLLVLEDAHWLDSASWALLEKVCRRGLPVLVAVAVRPLAESPPELGAVLDSKGCLHLPLAPLADDDALRLVCQVLGVGQVPEAVSRLVLAKAEGHPSFSEELAFALKESGALVVEGERCRVAPHVGDLQALDLPDTVQGVITSRIDRLSPAQQIVLKVASVIGRVFERDTLRDIHPVETDKDGIEGHLQSLQALEIAVPERSVAGAYTFKHNMTFETVYNLMLFEQRQYLHGEVAQWYEGRGAGDLSPFYPMLAYHWEQTLGGRGDDPARVRKAVDYLEKAGGQAMLNFANQEAADFYARALNVLSALPDTPERTDRELALLLALGPALMVVKGFSAPEVERTYARARELCREEAASPQLVPVLWGLIQYYIPHAALDTTLDLGRQLLETAQALDDPALLPVSHRALGEAHFYRGEFAAARGHLEKGLALYDPAAHGEHALLYGMDPGVACGSFLAWTLWSLGHPDSARRQSHATLELAAELAHPFSRAFALAAAAFLHQFLGERERVKELAAEILALSAEHGFPFWMTIGAVLQGWCRCAEGEVDAGLGQIRQGLGQYRGMGAKLVVPYCLNLLAGALEQAGRPDEALSLVDEALAETESTGEAWREAESLCLKGELLQALGQTETAGDFLLQAAERAREQGARSLELRAATDLGVLWRGGARQEEARRLLAQIDGAFVEGAKNGDRLRAGRVLRELAGG